MNTKHFESVFELAKTRNFNRAAENLYITQPALTYQINVIEEEIGFRLFDRSGKGAELTPAGEQFLATLHDIDNQLKQAIEQGQNFAFRYRDNKSSENSEKMNLLSPSRLCSTITILWIPFCPERPTSCFPPKPR